MEYTLIDKRFRQQGHSEQKPDKHILFKKIGSNIKIFLFAPRFRFNRIQFNLVAIFFIAVGVIAGTYLTLYKVFNVHAENDTIQTWTFNSANSNPTTGPYSYNSTLLSVNDSGAFPIANKFINPDFDTDLAGWTGAQNYSFYDQFTTDKTYTELAAGTNAEPTGGLRWIWGANSQVSITGGKFTVTGDFHEVWYPAVTRSSGKVLLGKMTAGQIFGFDDDTSPRINFATGEPIALHSPNGFGFLTEWWAGPFFGTVSNSTVYDVAIVLRSTGAYYFVKGGIYNNWTLLNVTSISSVANLYPTFYSYDNFAYTTDDLRIPVTAWLPTPLAYDSFDSSFGTTKSSGPDSQSAPQLNWTSGPGSNWTISGGKASNTPTLGAEANSDVGFDNPGNWTSQDPSTMYVSGSKLNFVSTGDSRFIKSPDGVVTDNVWYNSTFDIESISSGGIYAKQIAQQNYNIFGTIGTQTSIGRQIGTPIVMSTTPNYPWPVTTAVVDNFSYKPIETSALFATVDTSVTDFIAEVKVSTIKGTEAGLVLNLDSASNPQNFILVYSDGVYVHIEKAVGGVYTVLNANSDSPYSDGAILKVVRVGNFYTFLYNNHYVYSATISDASIISNTKFGLFSTYGGNTLDDFTLWSKGSNGEFNSLPADDLTATRDTGIKYSGAASAKLVATNDANFLQTVNVGNTSTYEIVAYAYTDGSAVSASDLSLYANGNSVSTTYTSVGGGWYQLSGSVAGVASSIDYGVRVKSGKTVYVDKINLVEVGVNAIYVKTAYQNANINSWDQFCEGTLVGITCTGDATHTGSANIKYQLCDDDGSVCESGNSWKYWNGSSWATATDLTTTVNTTAQLTNAAMNAFPTTNHKISVKAIIYYDGTSTPYLPHISIGLTTDTTPPTSNASALEMKRNYGGTNVASNGWTKDLSPYFSWTAGQDNAGGVGLKGYCLYLGTDSAGDPATAKGLLGTSPVDTTGTPCQFIVADTSINFATSTLKGSTWLTTSNSPYYLNIKAVDYAGNVAGSSEQFTFRYDNVLPTNVSYMACASGSFSNVVDMNFNWPTTGGTTSSDSNSDILGWQYQINGTTGSWKGTSTDSTLGVDYIPTTDSAYTLDSGRDSTSIISGNNVVYFRTIDNAGNASSDATVRTCSLSYGGQAPTFGGTDIVTISPDTSVTNSCGLSWPAATASFGQNVAGYYYMVNTPPPSTYATLINNTSTYIPNGTSTTVDPRNLPNVNKGSNTIYVVAVDDASTPNYSPSNYISGTFTLNSTDPDNINNLNATDSSIKSQEKWIVALTWTEPVYQGAGNLEYLIYRSSDNVNFAQVGTTTGLAYFDNTPTSSLFYYKVYTKDGAEAQSSGTNAVSIFPTGRWTTPPDLQAGPSVTNISTKRATINWSTSRTADSKVKYGTQSTVYNPVESSSSSQVASHSIELSGLNPSTTYFYKAKWTDEDGNTGSTVENNFTTAPAPKVKDIISRNIGLSSAIIQFTSEAASKVKIYYGPTTSFGGVKEIPTSTSEAVYTAELDGLLDGTKYYYKINTFDSDNNEYEGPALSFTTLPRPHISGVRVQQVANTAQSTILVTWNTNTEVSSIIVYAPVGDPSKEKNEVNLDLISGEHKMILRGLLPDTEYLLTIKGQDKVGNEAISDSQKVTTATDTRPPLISDLRIEGSNVPAVGTTGQESTAQLIVSWSTDEPSSGQVEFAEGTGNTYSQKTQEDSDLTISHIVIISNLTPSKVYHLRAVSSDKSRNVGRSIDTVTISPKATDNALNLVIYNLLRAFGFN